MRAASWGGSWLAISANWHYTECQSVDGRQRLTTKDVVDTLGGRKTFKGAVRTPEDLVLRLRTGLPYAALDAVREAFGLELKEMTSILSVPMRTLARRRKARRLGPEESDRLYRFGRILAMATETLGDREKASAWIRRANRALGDEVPLDHLDTDLGAREVEAVLGRMEFGVYS